MVLIIGGAWQGKLEFAKREFHLKDSDICTCSGAEIDFSKPCVNALEEFCYACIQKDIDPMEYVQAHRENWQNSILICCDLSSGVVPMDPLQRQWRHTTGRLCQYLAGQADRVSRIFCGLEQRLK